jgi:hypothetical protein
MWRSVGKHVTRTWRRPCCRGYELQAASTHLGLGEPGLVYRGKAWWCMWCRLLATVVVPAADQTMVGWVPTPHHLAPIFCVGGAVVDASCLVRVLGLSLIGGEAKNTPFCACPLALGSTAGPGEILA